MGDRDNELLWSRQECRFKALFCVLVGTIAVIIFASLFPAWTVGNFGVWIVCAEAYWNCSFLDHYEDSGVVASQVLNGLSLFFLLLGCGLEMLRLFTACCSKRPILQLFPRLFLMFGGIIGILAFFPVAKKSNFDWASILAVLCSFVCCILASCLFSYSERSHTPQPTTLECLTRFAQTFQRAMTSCWASLRSGVLGFFRRVRRAARCAEPLDDVSPLHEQLAIASTNLSMDARQLREAIKREHRSLLEQERHRRGVYDVQRSRHRHRGRQDEAHSGAQHQDTCHEAEHGDHHRHHHESYHHGPQPEIVGAYDQDETQRETQSGTHHKTHSGTRRGAHRRSDSRSGHVGGSLDDCGMTPVEPERVVIIKNRQGKLLAYFRPHSLEGIPGSRSTSAENIATNASRTSLQAPEDAVVRGRDFAEEGAETAGLSQSLPRLPAKFSQDTLSVPAEGGADTVGSSNNDTPEDSAEAAADAVDSSDIIIDFPTRSDLNAIVAEPPENVIIPTTSEAAVQIPRLDEITVKVHPPTDSGDERPQADDIHPLEQLHEDLALDPDQASSAAGGESEVLGEDVSGSLNTSASGSDLNDSTSQTKKPLLASSRLSCASSSAASLLSVAEGYARISTQSSPTGSVDRINTSTPVKSGSPGGAVGGLDFSLDSVDDEDQDKEEENMGPLDMSSGDIDVFPDPVESERGLAAVGSVSQPGGAEEGAAGAE
ncbi:hypothetical protein BaRGS_00000878 [Batillaria attramentaria]|uniref:Transmembrane protein n=1 Tax=Batillaria attramentaria TaxID=370345 RepID=A0ABD0M8S6_9CAEN